MIRYLLDTDVCIHYLNETTGEVADKLLAKEPDTIFLSSVVKGELLYGARHSSAVQQNLDRLDIFFEPFESISFDDEAARYYGVLRAELRREGRPIGGNDMMIASMALAHDMTLVTRNIRDFRRVSGLRFERW